MGIVSAGQGLIMDIYARLSPRGGDGQDIAVDDQVEMGVETITDRGATVGEIFRDESKSAWKPNVVRPDWLRLMKRLESGVSNGVAIYDLTRFSRKILEGERLVDLASTGVQVWSWSGAYDLSTADGRRHFRDDMVAAAAESDKISERTRRGKLRKAKRGGPAGGTRSFAMRGLLPAPAGWERGDPREFVPEDVYRAEREEIADAYSRLLAGESLISVVTDLNERGVTTVHGAEWTMSTFTKTLKRPALAGLRVHKGEIIGVLPDVEPIVSREEWERLCAIFDARKVGRPPGRVHVMSNLILCGGCAYPMLGMSRSAVAPYEDGETRREYLCRRTPHYRDRCGRNSIDARVLEGAMGEAVKARLGDPRRAEQISAKVAQEQAERTKIEMEIARQEENADALGKKTKDWGVERVDKSMQPILKRLAELRKGLEELNEGKTVSAPIDVDRIWDEAEATNDFDTMRSLVRQAFPQLTLKPRGFKGDQSVERLDFDGETLLALAA